MAFDPPDGILDIGNATLRVGKLEVAETSGLNQGLQNIIKNDLLVTENTEYIKDHKWGLKLPTTWVAEFEVKGHSGKYIDFNFYNENSASNAQGYNLTFKDTSLTLKYDGGNNLPITGDTVDSTLSLGDAGYGVATIPTIVGAYRKVNIFFERGVISVSIDGTRYLYFKESDGYNAVHGHPGVASRVVSTTGSAFVNVFIESDNENNSAFKNLRIVNGRFISDKTSNIAFIGGNLGVGVNSPKESLDILGNMHLTRVSNVSQIKVDSNVVTEYTGPHDRPLRKYPEVALTSASYNAYESGYKVTVSGFVNSTNLPWKAFNGIDYEVGMLLSGLNYDTNGNANTTGTTASRLSPSDSTPYGEWLKLELPNKIKLDRYVFTSRNSATTSTWSQSVEAGQVWGSNSSDSDWVHLHTITNSGFTGGSQSASFNVRTDNYYKYYAFIVTKTFAAGSDGYLCVPELKYYGYEEGDSSLDTTLKSVYNVPATTGTQLEVYYDGQDYTVMPTVGSASVTDKAGGDQTGTPSSGVSFDSTYKAFNFDGTTNGKITGTHNLSGTSPTHTISIWFKRTVVDGSYDYVLAVGTSTTAQNSAIVINNDQIWFSMYGDDVRSSIKIVNDVWYHLTVTSNGGIWNSTNCKMYINGGLTSTTSGGGGTLNLTGTQFTLGTNSVGGEQFNGSIANFRLFSKVLNADQVKELYDYQKDYFLGSKTQVTLYKGHLGVGVTEPSGQLELAGDERIQEYPPGPLGPSTSYETHVPGHGVFCWDTVNYYPGSPNENYNGSGMYAKDGATTGWYGPYQGQNGYTSGDVYAGTDFAATSSSGLGFNDAYGNRYYGAWTTFKLPYKINLKKIHIDQWATSDGANARCAPEDGVILGSNNGVDWYHVHTFTGLQYGGSAGNPSYSAVGEDVTITCTTDYSQYALVVTRTLHYAFTAMIGELRWFGTPGPTTLDKGSLTLGRSLDVPRVSRYDVDTETPRPEKLVVDFDTTINSSPTDISGKGNNGIMVGATYSAPDKAFKFNGNQYIQGDTGLTGNFAHSISMWFNANNDGQLFWTGINGNSGDRLNIFFSEDGGFAGNTTTPQINYTFKGHTHYVDVNLNQWHHLVCIYDGTNSAGRKIYLDGVRAGSDDITDGSRSSGSEHALNIQTSTFYLNKANYTGGSLVGSISQFKLYNVALEPSEVRKLYILGRTGRSMVISDTAVGIGKAPEAQLDVRGLIKGVNATKSVAAWSVASSINLGSVSVATTINWNIVVENVGGCYYNTKFHAPISGYYYHSFHMITRSDSETTFVDYYINDAANPDGSDADFGSYDAGASTGHRNIAGSWTVYLNAGDTLKMVLKDGSMNGNLNRWSGFFIST